MGTQIFFQKMRFSQFFPFANLVFSQDDESDFIPPEERFDFGNMNRQFIRNEENPEKNALNYEMKTIKQTRIAKKIIFKERRRLNWKSFFKNTAKILSSAKI